MPSNTTWITSRLPTVTTIATITATPSTSASDHEWTETQRAVSVIAAITSLGTFLGLGLWTRSRLRVYKDLRAYALGEATDGQTHRAEEFLRTHPDLATRAPNILDQRGLHDEAVLLDDLAETQGVGRRARPRTRAPRGVLASIRGSVGSFRRSESRDITTAAQDDAAHSNSRDSSSHSETAEFLPAGAQHSSSENSQRPESRVTLHSGPVNRSQTVRSAGAASSVSQTESFVTASSNPHGPESSRGMGIIGAVLPHHHHAPDGH